MLIAPTLEKIKGLRLYGIAKSFEEQINSDQYHELSFEERIGLMIDRETEERNNRRLRSRLKNARLRQQASMEDIDYLEARGIDRSLMRKLSDCQWIREHLNIIITGPTGAGKSYIACALGHRACLEGYRVLYFRASRLFQDIAISKGDGRYSKLMNSITKSDLIIIDDWGLSVLNEHEQNDFLEILEERHGIHSTIISGQLPVENWHEAISNPTLADAILDRLIHSAYRINMKGGSMRKKKSKLT